MLQQPTATGFSLLELLICLSLLSIFVAIACPSFQEPLNRANCLEAKLLLLEAANQLENYHSQFHRYAGVSLAELGVKEWTEHKSHHFELSSSDTNYLIRAIPNNNECGFYSIGREGLIEKDERSQRSERIT